MSLSIRDAFRTGWMVYKRSAGMLSLQFITVGLVVLMVGMAQSLLVAIGGAMADRGGDLGLLLGGLTILVGSIVAAAIIGALSIGLGMSGVDAVRGELRFGSIFAFGRRPWGAMLVWATAAIVYAGVLVIVIGLAVGLAALLSTIAHVDDEEFVLAIVVIGSIIGMLAFPLIIWLSAWSTSALFTVCDPRCRAVTVGGSILRGCRFASASRFRLCGLMILIQIVWMVGATVTLGIGGIVIGPFLFCVLGAAYESLQVSHDATDRRSGHRRAASPPDQTLLNV